MWEERRGEAREERVQITADLSSLRCFLAMKSYQISKWTYESGI